MYAAKDHAVVMAVAGSKILVMKDDPGHPIQESARQLDTSAIWTTVLTLLMYSGSAFGAAWDDVPEMLKNAVIPGQVYFKACALAQKAPAMRLTSLATIKPHTYGDMSPEYPMEQTTLPTKTLSANGSR